MHAALGEFYDSQDPVVERMLPAAARPPREGVGEPPRGVMEGLPETESRAAGAANYEQNASKREDFSPLTRSRTGSVERNSELFGERASDIFNARIAADTAKRLAQINRDNKRVYNDSRRMADHPIGASTAHSSWTQLGAHPEREDDDRALLKPSHSSGSHVPQRSLTEPLSRHDMSPGEATNQQQERRRQVALDALARSHPQLLKAIPTPRSSPADAMSRRQLRGLQVSNEQARAKDFWRKG